MLIYNGIVVAIYCVISYFFLNLIYSVQPTPFIDEIFHVPQAVKYCERRYYDWDPKITTLPGLYIFSSVLHEITTLPCTVYALRLYNCMVSNLMLVLFIAILTILHHTEKDPNKNTYVLWTAFNLATFPPLYFYSFLYYTEILSTCSFLLVFYLHLKGKYYAASIIGLACFAVRQTNIIWIGFLILHYLTTHVLVPIEDFWKWPLDLKGKKYRLVRAFGDMIAYFILCVFVLSFFIWNKGIVVGDRTAHVPVFHGAQLYHFGIFTAFFSCSFNFRKIAPFFQLMTKVKFIVLLLTSALVVTYFSYAHIYLLSDNRHYSFYYWKIYTRNVFLKYLLLPINLFGLYCIHENLTRFPWRHVFWLCTCMNLIPQHLLEFRYFILPFVINRMHFKIVGRNALILETCLNACVNIFVLAIFKMKTFYWDDSSDLQRIIW